MIDAVLGAAALGDIGRHFPDDDPRYEGADSIELLRGPCRGSREAGWRVVNVDATVICERPTIAATAGTRWRSALPRRSGSMPAGVNVKATTNEGMGFIGRGEGIAAIAVAQVERR